MTLLKQWRRFGCSCRSQSSNALDPASLKQYSPEIEKPLINRWTSHKLFTPSQLDNNAPVFSTILPPPNVTGTLHLGHALTVSIADVLCRWSRMRGHQVLWVPGTDHAGIATQAVVEKDLRSKNLSRHRLGREKFIDEVWKWKKVKSQRIIHQLNVMGASLDWSREYFTLDEGRSEAVTYALIKLWNAGLVYRAESLVNWSCHLRSAISDIEVDHLALDGPSRLNLPGYEKPITFGQLDYFAYKLEDSEDEVVVATTRLETMLGDVAVAVHPHDNRFHQFHDRRLLHPLTNERIPVVLDENVDPMFGTGAVKVTPAHDATDFEIAKRLGLPMKRIIADDGTMNEECGTFFGMKRFEVREALREKLSDMGLFRKIEPHKTSLPVCSRSGDVIELQLKPQWFIKCDGMAQKAMEAVETGQLTIRPEKYNKMWFSWLNNIKDWCISRQLWWGHQAPFYRCSADNVEIWVAATNSKDALTQASKQLCGEIRVDRDEDVLDTWLSSALLPFSSLDWPQKVPDLDKYFPLSTMITGHDILFFWVARMTMLSLELTGKLPFKEVFLHSIVCDAQGRKMSKSLGNIIDPMDIIEGRSKEVRADTLLKSVENDSISEIKSCTPKTFNGTGFPDKIPECGADALRFSLLSQSVKSTYMNFSVDKCISNNHFCNKIWQASRFSRIWADKLKIEDEGKFEESSHEDPLDVWILSKLGYTVNTVNAALNQYDFHVGTAALREFLYSDLCDIYIEAIKPRLHGGRGECAAASCRVLLHCFDVALRCLAPFMPFVSETLYATLPCRSHDSIHSATYPTDFKLQNEDVLQNVEYALTVVRLIRKLKTEQGSLYRKNKVYILSERNSQLEELTYLLEALTRSNCVVAPKNSCSESLSDGFRKENVDSSTEIYVEVEALTPRSNLTPEQLSKRRSKITSELQKLSDMTSAEAYKIKVPEKIQLTHRQKMIQLKAELGRISSSSVTTN